MKTWQSLLYFCLQRMNFLSLFIFGKIVHYSLNSNRNQFYEKKSLTYIYTCDTSIWMRGDREVLLSVKLEQYRGILFCGSKNSWNWTIQLVEESLSLFLHPDTLLILLLANDKIYFTILFIINRSCYGSNFSRKKKKKIK